MGGGSEEPARHVGLDDGSTSFMADAEQLHPAPVESNVLVTGFGEFPKGSGQPNTSHLVTQLLPATISVKLPPPSMSDRSSMIRRELTNPTAIKVNLVRPTIKDGMQGIPVEYAKCRSYVAELYDEHVGRVVDRHGRVSVPEDGVAKKRDPVDLFLHIGMADGWDFVSVERAAYKQGFSSTWWSMLESSLGYYMIPDNSGKTILDSGPCPWIGTPTGLSTSFEVDGLVEAVKKRREKSVIASSISDSNAATPSIPVKAHAEPGSYTCGFIYYESLAQCWVRGREADVLFCHVPGYTDENSLDQCRAAIIAVIEEAVLQLVARRST